MATVNRTTYRLGALLSSDVLTVPDPTPEQANENAIRAQAKTALATNRDFVNLAAPANAQILTEVKALARQNNGIIRLLLGALEATD